MWDFSRPPGPLSKWWKVTAAQQAQQARIAERMARAPANEQSGSQMWTCHPGIGAEPDQIFVPLRPYEVRLLEWVATTYPHVSLRSARATLIAERDSPGVWARFMIAARGQQD
jgi:hypothetical protein